MKRLVKENNKNLLQLSRKEFVGYISNIIYWPEDKINRILNNFYSKYCNQDEVMTRMLFIDYLVPRGNFYY